MPQMQNPLPLFKTVLALVVALATVPLPGCGTPDDSSPEDADTDDFDATDADDAQPEDADAETDGDADADTDADADSDPDEEVRSDADIDADWEVDTDSGGDADADTDQEADAESDVETDGETDWEEYPDADADDDIDGDAELDADIDEEGDGGGEECPEPSSGALSLDGVDDHVAVEPAAALGLDTFTLEAWIRWDGSGVATRSGSDSVPIIPVIAKGRTEADGSSTDCNYLFGIHEETHTLAADFEDIASGSSHPVIGSTPIEPEVWQHVAVTYDGSTWRLYLNGEPDGDLAVDATPRHDSVHSVGLGTAFNSSGTPAGAFGGAFDELRVWNRVRTPEEIVDGLSREVADLDGLVAWWALDEGAGDFTADVVDEHQGVVVGAAWLAEGAPFAVGSPPSISLDAPADGETVAADEVELAMRVDDDREHSANVEIWGRPIDPDFTVVVLPDTQNYASDYPETYVEQTRWVHEHAAEYNVRAVLHVGDLLNDPLSEEEWLNVDAAMAELEEPVPGWLPDGIPYGIALGNHDTDGSSTVMFNRYFGEDRFIDRPWYGGHYDTDNDNHYILFEAGSMQFLAVFLEWSPPDSEPLLEWVREVLLDHPDHRALLTMHYLISAGNPGAWGGYGSAVYEALRDVPTLDLMFCGHQFGEGRRTDTFEGHAVTTLLANYQGREHGGNGWLRLLTFSPARGSIQVRTWSTLLEEWEIDDDSEFELPYELTLPPFELVAERSGVTPGSEVRTTWSGLEPGRTYQWHARAESCWFERSSDTWSFQTR